MEGIVTETDDSHKKFVASRKQRSARIHSAIERLLQIKQANQTKIHDEKNTSRRRTEAHSRTRKTGSVQKHKGCNPRKITSKQVKELYEFYMKNKHKKRQKKMCVALSVKSEVPIDGLPIPSQHTGTAVQDTSAQQSNLPMSLQMLNAAAQAIPSTQSFTFPTGFSQMITLPDGTQQPAFFFIVNAPPNTAGVERENCKSSDNSVINPQVMLQPVALNTTCPTAEKCTTDFSVIEKAMELASVRSSCTPANNEQPSPSQYPVGTESYKEETEGGCHSAPLETIALEDISVTVQTAESPMAAPSSELVATGTTNTLDVTPINNLVVSEIRNQGIIINRPEQNLTVPQKPCMKYKPSKFCEATTQTGAKEAIPTLANTMVEKARIEGVLTLEAKKEKEGVAKKQAERVRRHPCTVCNKLFFTNHDLKRHKLTHSNERPFMCDICKKTFRTQNELKLHTPIHSDTTPYQCEYCGKEFRTKGCIKSHIKYHIGDKRHKCVECGRAFVKSADLKRHMAGHKNEKNFKCEECGSAFTRRDNLKAHMLLHSRNGVVTCDLCNKEFINEVYLKRHMHIHKLAKKKPYECQWCPKTYEQLEGLRRHIRQHVGDEKFVCKQCDKKFITSIQLKRHLWLTHEHDSPYRRSIL